MKEYKLKYDPSRIEVDDWLEAERGNIRAVRNVITSCMVDDNGAPMSREEAEAALKEKHTTLAELDKLAEELIKEINNAATNPTSRS